MLSKFDNKYVLILCIICDGKETDMSKMLQQKQWLT